MQTFKAVIHIIGINPFVFVPENILLTLFKANGKDKGPIPIHGTINGLPYQQTLMKYQGDWRLYINTSMLKDSPKRIGETIELSVEYDAADRTIAMHPLLKVALLKNPLAKDKFESLNPSLKKEIVRYIANLKTKASIDRNVEKAINFLLGKEKFIGREPLP